MKVSPSCIHHYDLSAPGGEFCAGVCRKCGDVRKWRTASYDPPLSPQNRYRIYKRPVLDPRRFEYGVGERRLL